MNLDAFLYDLQLDPDKTRPMDLEVDWEDAPLPYKLYRDLPVVPLSPEVPLTLEEQVEPTKPDLRQTGHFLWYVYGITQLSQSVFSLDSTKKEIDLLQSYRRFTPSGGGLYPSELYVYLKLDDLPAGVYHYDVAHHRLVLLREGNFDLYLNQALGNRCDISACFGTVLVSTMFWKNFFKYNNFAYRLQGLDAGVLIGQLLEVSKRFGFETMVFFQFLDRAVNHLLGLTEQEESAYAVIPLSVEPANTCFTKKTHGHGAVSATELCKQLTPVHHVHYIRSRKISEYPQLIKINEASLQESTHSFKQIEWGKEVQCEGLPVELCDVNRLSYDLATVCRKRYSPGMDFVLGKISQKQISTLLKEATDSRLYRNDLDGTKEHSQFRVSLYASLYNVEGIPNGAYCYSSTNHTLVPGRLGDLRFRLQQGMTLDNVNLFQTPLCLHVAGERDHLLSSLGYRGYRIQQMEAGILTQRLLLAASAIGMGGHPLLGFDVNSCDEMYNMAPQGKTSLIQIPVGYYSIRSRLQGGLYG